MALPGRFEIKIDDSHFSHISHSVMTSSLNCGVVVGGVCRKRCQLSRFAGCDGAIIAGTMAKRKSTEVVGSEDKPLRTETSVDYVVLNVAPPGAEFGAHWRWERPMLRISESCTCWVGRTQFGSCRESIMSTDTPDPFSGTKVFT